jgi:hypothetical protein
MSSGRTTDGGRFSTIWIKTTNLCSSWGERYLHDRRSVCHKQGFRCIKRITLYATQPLVAQDRAGVEVIRLTPSRVCGESFLMIHALPHATAPVQYSSTVFDKKSIPTIRTPCNAYVEKCFTLVWNTSPVAMRTPHSAALMLPSISHGTTQFRFNTLGSSHGVFAFWSKLQI